MSYEALFTDSAPIRECENREESYGEICVHCNRCGRFSPYDNKRDAMIDEMLDAAYRRSIENEQYLENVVRDGR